MSLLNVFQAVSAQFETAAQGLRFLRQPHCAQTDENNWRDRNTRLYQEAFSLLAGGDGLPFFRQNYLDVSAGVFLLTEELKSLAEWCPELTGGAPSAVGECLRNAESALAALRLAWTRFQEDTAKSAREAMAALPLILAAQESMTRLRKSDAEGEKSQPGWNALIRRLLSLDLALKKMIAVAKV